MIIFLIVLLVASRWSGAKFFPMDAGIAQQPMHWFEGTVKKQAWPALDEIIILPQKTPDFDDSALAERLQPGAGVLRKQSEWLELKLPAPMTLNGLKAKLSEIRVMPEIQKAYPVFYAAPTRTPELKKILTDQIIVRFSESLDDKAIAEIQSYYGLKRVKTFTAVADAFLYEASDPFTAFEIAKQLHESGQTRYAYPEWMRSRIKRAVPNDSLFENQWHLENTGQGGGIAGEDVNITGVWNHYRGTDDEVIAIVDDGLEITHEDLQGNVLAGQSWDYGGDDSDPSPMADDEKHGTSCAGVAAAVGFNAIGVCSAAPASGLVGHRIPFDITLTDSIEAQALSDNNGLIDVYSNRWGPFDGGTALEGPGPLAENAIENSTLTGRAGLGNIYVWAGGNGEDSDNSNYDGYANMRFTISVAATTNLGDRAWYSEKGANHLVNAPSSGGTIGITTTDRIGSTGYSSTNYTSIFGGTSSAAPLVSGIIALLLEANPSLTWRDVQHVLLSTAEKNDPTDADWQQNAAQYWINHQYGFGRIEAQAAISAAETWVSGGDETSVTATSSPGLPIPDDNAVGVTDTIVIAENINIDFVEVYLTSDHPYWGDLRITVVSPYGTESILSEAHFSGYDTFSNWRFGTVRHFAELSAGTWALTVKDLLAADTGTLTTWTLKIYGTSNTGAHSINASASSNGTISPSGNVTVDHRAVQEFSITPNPDCIIKDVLVDGLSVGVTNSYRFSYVVADHSIEAVFLPTYCSITASAGTGGTISPPGCQQVPYGGTQTFLIEANSGYHIDNVLVDDISKGALPSYTFTNVTTNHSISARFEADSTSTNGDGGEGGGGCFIDTAAF